MRIFSLKQVPTMTVPKWSWRKSPSPEKGDVICTRLILQAAIGAVKKYEFQRGSVRTICCCKWTNRTAKGGEDLPCLQFRYTPLPDRQTIPPCLPKSTVIVVSTHAPGSHKCRHTIPAKKRMLPGKAASSFQLLGSVFVHFQQDLE